MVSRLPGTIFIPVSQNSLGFICKLARRGRPTVLFQTVDVTVLARAKSLTGVTTGRTGAGCSEDNV